VKKKEREKRKRVKRSAAYIVFLGEFQTLFMPAKKEFYKYGK
jgi:hypothetical protein